MQAVERYPDLFCPRSPTNPSGSIDTEVVELKVIESYIGISKDTPERTSYTFSWKEIVRLRQAARKQ